jgi:hypothetical protein
MEQYRLHTRTLNLLVVIILTCCAGCGRASNDTDENKKAAIDPRYASADSVLATYNSLVTKSPVEAARALELFYAESPAQQHYLSIAMSTVPLAEWDWFMFEKFGEGASRSAKHPQLSPDAPAVIFERGDRRVKARYKDNDGEEQTLYLVQIGDRWWVSGYTLEYDKTWRQMVGDAEGIDENLKKFAEACGPVIERLKRGEFKSADEARKALGKALVEAVPFKSRQ